jgi:hypothetical protein
VTPHFLEIGESFGNRKSIPIVDNVEQIVAMRATRQNLLNIERGLAVEI